MDKFKWDKLHVSVAVINEKENVRTTTKLYVDVRNICFIGLKKLA